MAVLIRRLSPERLGPYVIAGGDDNAAALRVYHWNSEVSAALAVTIGHVEVIMRNAIHENLTEWSARRFGEPRWYLDPGHLLQRRQAEVVQLARMRARQRGETPGQVVAELSLGFWRYLLANHYDSTLWRESLYRAFPGQPRRRVLHEAVEVLHRSRNRIAHHEPMFNRPIEDIHIIALEVAGWICPVSKAWIARHGRVEQMLAHDACLSLSHDA
ncbi:Abi family protein [Actinoplanes sp. CA-030573]|uniref:Abi family protein n=1 Tax=Actinoplanes sp. CA-030573 TaxID=3239898 RepID=UPI003D948542